MSFLFPLLPIIQPTLVGTEQPDDSDADLVADDQELNYGERSDSNHAFGGTNSVYNDNHVMVGGPEPGQVRRRTVMPSPLVLFLPLWTGYLCDVWLQLCDGRTLQGLWLEYLPVYLIGMTLKVKVCLPDSGF